MDKIEISNYTQYGATRNGAYIGKRALATPRNRFHFPLLFKRTTMNRITALYIDTLLFKANATSTNFRVYEKEFATCHPSRLLISGKPSEIVNSPLFKEMKKRVFSLYVEGNSLCVEVY